MFAHENGLNDGGLNSGAPRVLNPDSPLHVQLGERPHRAALCPTRTKTTYLSSQFCTWGQAEQAIQFHPNSGTPSGSGECVEELSY